MAFMQLNFYSNMLGMQTDVYIVIPQKFTDGEIGIDGKKDDGAYKCLYLLHGLTDDHTIWLRRTSIERYASEYGICVVMPCGDRSFYTDMKYGMKYFSYITEELPNVVREFLKVSDKREDNYIAGLSMGGYGALKIALKEHGTFGAAAGLSSVANIRRPGWEAIQYAIWGDELQVPDEDDLFYLVEQCEKFADRPRLYMAVGTRDYMYEDNVRLKEKIESLDYDYTYREGAGTHDWTFWDEYIQYVLAWMFR